MFTSNDRAANYGDGIFTTMLVENGAVALFERHVSRLLSDSSKLRLNVNEDELRRAIANEVSTCESGVLKLLISSGEGGRGYLRGNSTSPGFHFSKHTLPASYSKWQQQGVNLGVSDIHLASQPLLAGSKHLNRLEQVMIKQSLAQTNFDDVIVCDYDGHVIEASAANLFWCINDMWFTPSVTRAGVAGVMRSFMLDYLTHQGNHIVICASAVKELANADTIFMCNSLMKLVPVRTLEWENTLTEYDQAVVSRLQQTIESKFKEEYVSFS
ncbi:aminodeoxychorismate lyase [Alteromonas ponticola]|uniref:Aminodeoxychorismate lyase n=1 Tax=Alteromonas aquimaris TaxID=2998417 RepID=A0ABT3P7F0_9ALTE|nr:aminodeoxychorismate lyase [Alteromonas aquimaris]MCW8108701.1 aminodeoxychorismate lyase [Alteromonas aquimaris]